MAERIGAIARIGCWGCPVAVLAALWSPWMQLPPNDSFPLSTYPMFASARRHLNRLEAVVVLADGSTQPIALDWLGGGEPLEAFAHLERAAAQGESALRPLCRKLAAKVGAAQPAMGKSSVRIVRRQVIPGPHHFAAGAKPRAPERWVGTALAVCDVPLHGGPGGGTPQ